jgi:Raf kinase inhibitor-like YbhB/YbcL family protein
MNQSPALAWTGAPAGTMSFAISMFDATMRNTHWILWDIPADTTMLPANLPRGAMPAMPAGATQKSAFGGTPGYEGPGAGPGSYEIEIWALNVAKLPANIAGMSLNAMHTVGLGTVKISSVKLLARGQRNGF